LLSLQSTADLLATTQSRLSTGKKVNTALDNPTNFFTAQSLDGRASDISAMVQHRQLNLLHDFSQLNLFDVIFCRNVLIYFDQSTKADIFNRLTSITQPDGFLVLGAAESVVGLTDVFKPVPERRGLYRPDAAQAARARIPAVSIAAPKVASMSGR
jgi:chemotaxis protein methyltransferase CheR